MNVKGPSFEAFTCRVFPTKKGSKKRPRGYVYLQWKKRMSDAKIGNSNLKVKCPICFETKPALSLNCGHLFCKDCAPRLRGKSCAICRTFCIEMHPIYVTTEEDA